MVRSDFRESRQVHSRDSVRICRVWLELPDSEVAADMGYEPYVNSGLVP